MSNNKASSISVMTTDGANYEYQNSEYVLNDSLLIIIKRNTKNGTKEWIHYPLQNVLLFGIKE